MDEHQYQNSTIEDYGNTKHTIASYLTSYLKEKMLISHLQFTVAYGET